MRRAQSGFTHGWGTRKSAGGSERRSLVQLIELDDEDFFRGRKLGRNLSLLGTEARSNVSR